jgi:hypothetical protein
MNVMNENQSPASLHPNQEDLYCVKLFGEVERDFGEGSPIFSSVWTNSAALWRMCMLRLKLEVLAVEDHRCRPVDRKDDVIVCGVNRRLIHLTGA